MSRWWFAVFGILLVAAGGTDLVNFRQQQVTVAKLRFEESMLEGRIDAIASRLTAVEDQRDWLATEVQRLRSFCEAPATASSGVPSRLFDGANWTSERFRRGRVPPGTESPQWQPDPLSRPRL